mgnify:CR=1 FL=1
MKKVYIIGFAILLIMVIFFSFLFFSNPSINYCKQICEDVSNQMEIEILEVFTTNNNDNNEGCRCEFSNGQIMGFGIDRGLD